MDPTEGDDSAGDPAAAEQAGDRQPEAVRRQQLLVASGVAALSGVAVAVASIQQFPQVPVLAAVGGGMVTTALVYGLLYASVFRG